MLSRATLSLFWYGVSVHADAEPRSHMCVSWTRIWRKFCPWSSFKRKVGCVHTVSYQCVPQMQIFALYFVVVRSYGGFLRMQSIITEKQHYQINTPLVVNETRKLPLKCLYWPFQGGTSFVNHLCFFVSCVSHAFASVHCCLVVTCWKGLISRLLLLMFIVFCYFPMWYPGSGVVFDCIVSWSLPSFLLSSKYYFNGRSLITSGAKSWSFTSN